MTGVADNSAAIIAVLEAIEQVRRAFGAPGDHGYGTREGQALYKLYMARPGLHDLDVEIRHLRARLEDRDYGC